MEKKKNKKKETENEKIYRAVKTAREKLVHATKMARDRCV